MLLLKKEIELINEIINVIKNKGGDIPFVISVINENINSNVKQNKADCYSVLSLKDKNNIKSFLEFFSNNRTSLDVVPKNIKHFENIMKTFCLEYLRKEYIHEKDLAA